MPDNRKRAQSSTANGAHPDDAKAAANSPEPLAFEEALGQLDEAVAALESGDLTLEDALRVFEEGVRLTQRCQEALDNAELRIQRLRLRDSTLDVGSDSFALDDFDEGAQQ
jgi:exodeoxyribonuclease VII small subunit